MQLTSNGVTITIPDSEVIAMALKPWRRTIRRRTLRESLARVAGVDQADLFTSANSYFGLLRQASHSHGDRAVLANVVRRRGHVVDRAFTKTFRTTPR